MYNWGLSTFWDLFFILNAIFVSLKYLFSSIKFIIFFLTIQLYSSLQHFLLALLSTRLYSSDIPSFLSSPVVVINNLLSK